MVKDYIKKIPTFIAFFKLLLGHVKVEIMLKFMVFFGSFLDAPTQSLTSSFFDKKKVLRWYISQPSLIYVWFAIWQFSSFKCFHSSRKFEFELLLGRFLGHNSPQMCPSLHGGSSQNMFAEVADNVILLTFFCWSRQVYNLEITSYMSITATKMWLKWNEWGSNKVIRLTVMQELKCAQMIIIGLTWT